LGITFDWTISLGSIVTFASLLTVFLRAHIANVKRLQKIETELEIIYNWFQKHVIKSDD